MLFAPRYIRTGLLLLLSLILLMAWLIPETQAQSKLPRFASLRSDKVNLRAGPGVRYPVSWVFVRKSLPVEILAEFELWRKVRSQDGTEGWIHKSLLTGRRSAVIVGKVRTLYRKPDSDVPVLRAEPGVQGRLLACKKNWCQLQIGGTEGWLRRQQVWGAYKGENFD